MGWKKILFGRLIPTLVGTVAVFVGWLSRHEVPAGLLFATIIPAMKGYMPPSIVGHGKMVGTPEVPDDMAPQPRPEKELFLQLPGGYFMPQNGLGGRHIDGAHLYLNHRAIGQGITEAIRRGVPREEIFVTTKIFPSQYGYQSALDNVQTYLEELGLDYIDLVLLHFPSIPPLLSSPCKKEGFGPTECRLQTWKALTELRDEKGLIRNAGVSNFAVKHLQELDGVGAPVANNQIQFNPFEPEHVMETIDYCAQHNITITAYSPLGGMMDQDKAMANEIVTSISNKYGKSKSEIMLRWAIQRGCAVIPGTGNPKHQKENLSIYEFELSDEDMKTINELKYTAKGFTHIDMRKMK